MDSFKNWMRFLGLFDEYISVVDDTSEGNQVDNKVRVARSMVSANQCSLPWKRIGFGTS